ncbi:MAG: putative virulence factor [Deltaproteobacteria bacterium]|jgi:hypothetical protein|nr:putative virulence factor [Deltaproteobacteria bacterium]
MLPDELKSYAINLRDAARDGDKWLLDNEDNQGNQEGVKKRLRKSARNLESYAKASENKMGIAVFGPSQVGKSTMISALASGAQSKKLMVDFQGRVLNFITQVNPVGGGETTGLVTRFSLAPPPQSPDPNLPVCLKLFSEMDIVKILANTYFAEAKGGGEVDETRLTQVLARLESKATTPRFAPSLDQMEDLAEYVGGISSAYISGRDLSRLFWPRAVDLAQKLEIGERAQLFSFIWGCLDEFTLVYQKLYRALMALNFPDVAFTELKAIYEEFPPKEDGTREDGRKNSVLHVGTLVGLLSENNDSIYVMNQQGVKTMMERPVLSALIAELHARVSESPGDFMLNADVLDFPGYRSRKPFENIKENVADPVNLKDCFLRGKVAYVFERYANLKEITFMLLFLRDGNMETGDLATVVSKWIGDTHGTTPEARTGKPICLFMVLNFFNNHLKPDDAATDLRAVWANRLHASIKDGFQKFSWPDAWSREGGVDRPFSNVYWLLKVYFTLEYLEVDEVQGSETQQAQDRVYLAKGVKKDKQEWIAKLKEGYLKTELVNHYFRDPDEAWRGVLESPDGGTSYIISKLTPLTRDDIKTRQLADLTFRECESVYDTLKGFYKGGTDEEEKAAKKQTFIAVASILSRLGNPGSGGADGSFHRFGLLLRDLTLSDDECFELFNRPVKLAPPEEALRTRVVLPNPDQPPAPKPGDDFIQGIFGAAKPAPAAAVPAPAEDAAPKPGSSPRQDDMANHYRRILEKEWQEGLERLTVDVSKRRYYSFSTNEFRLLIAELEQAAWRLGVMNAIEAKFRVVLGYGNINPEGHIWQLSRVASAGLSGFINFLGYNPRERNREERTISFQGTENLLFEPPAPVVGFPRLPEEAPAYEVPYHYDWMKALYQLMMDNVDFVDVNYKDNRKMKEANERLGTILEAISGARAQIAP